MNKTLQLSHPHLISEWYFEKNQIMPVDVTAGSNIKVWWKCNKADDHEWEAAICSRTSGRGCPCCRGLKVVKSNCLATVNPILTSQWHSVKNGQLTPNDVALMSNIKVWWKCNKADDHEWEAAISNRRKHGCPFCSGRKVDKQSSLVIKKPELLKEWHSKNVISPYSVSSGSDKKVWWICSKQHEWLAKVNHRSRGSNCPYCKLSKGELKIENILKNKQLNFKPQYRIDDCKDKLSLPFDFAVWLSERLYLIEYQGKQHYEITGFGTDHDTAKSNFEIIKKHDDTKSRYCLENNIPLLKIPFWKYTDIELMVDGFLQVDEV